MKLVRTKLRLQLKTGSLSKANRQACVQQLAKPKPVATSTSAKVPVAIASKPIIAHQVHVTNRSRRAARRSRDASHLPHTPLFPSSPSSASTSPSPDIKSETKDVRPKTAFKRSQAPFPKERSMQIALTPSLRLRPGKTASLARNSKVFRGIDPRENSTAKKELLRARRLLNRAVYNALHREGSRNTGSISELRSILGIEGSPRPSHSYTLLAIDTEFVSDGPCKIVTEIGLTTLKVADIASSTPGPHANNWVRRMKHCHIHLDRPEHPRTLIPPIFTTLSQKLSTESTKVLLKRFMRSLVLDPNTERVALVGHGVLDDVAAIINDPDLNFDIRKTGGAHVVVDRVFDTADLGEDAIDRGANFETLKLHRMLFQLGPDSKYCPPNSGLSVVGGHNASNDAAYSMMNLLLLLLRWDQLTWKAGSPPSLSPMDILAKRRADVHALLRSKAETKRGRKIAEYLAKQATARPGVKVYNFGKDAEKPDARSGDWISRLLKYFR